MNYTQRRENYYQSCFMEESFEKLVELFSVFHLNKQANFQIFSYLNNKTILT